MQSKFTIWLPIFVGTVISFMTMGCGICSAQAAENQESEVQQSEATETENDPYGLRDVPAEGQGIGVDDRSGNVLGMSTPFQDEQNNLLRVTDLFDGKRPVMLSFNYSNCPKLCSVQLQNMTLALREVDFKVGKDFQVVSLSIDPNEQTRRAKSSKEKYVKLYNQPESADGWKFLTGERKDIATITDECGFRFKYVPEQKLYSHPPVFILVSPKGKIVRYIHGLDYDPKTIELALIEAAEGKIGSPINILSYGLGCFSFNELTGKYTLQAMALMRIGGALTAVLLLIGLVPYWIFRRDKTENKDSNKTDEPLVGSTV